MVKAIIFDCFGVIRPDQFIKAYETLGGDYQKDREFVEGLMRAANKGIIASSRDIISEHLGVTVEQWMAEVDRDANTDKELLNYIEGLRAEYKTAVLSNASRGRLPHIIGEADATRCFDVLVESGSIGYAKPDPEAYEIVADKLGVRLDECLFTDDREEYCEGARAVGMRTIKYESFKQFKIDLGKELRP